MDIKKLFDSGISFDEFINSEDNKKPEIFKNRFETVNIDRSIKNIKNGSRVSNVLAFAESWCPDCQVSVPIMAKICAILGVNFRILKRKGHEEDMMTLCKDKEAKIPTFAFLDSDFNVLDIWIERPKIIKELVAKGDSSFRIGYVNGEYDKEIVDELLEKISRS
ncbi:thioredoxin family protein [Thermoanaerobacterium sp. R66]|uniref:thioredoxin family protein n=1 Tax=Thermoanaerobacterium sp. R66 TaxID=2742479 RepID=UPI001757E56C|nr:thioredoxin family protein [Thermoanaerobacterium sp. R66]MDE4543330.1 thioredoxin family protein [Thermoanaerobacterium sp. R66]HHV73816.1 thioredoxin family protein [Thermoanaerobacterium sp.]